jgi:N-acetylglucosamine-6-phosphate deacetylase
MKVGFPRCFGRLPSRRRITLPTAFGLVFFVGSAAAQETSRVEGLLYWDRSPAVIEIKDGKIERILRREHRAGAEEHLFFISPGLIDNQVNGYDGVTFSSAELTLDGVRRATRALWRDGVTTYLPTLTTNAHETLLHAFSILARAAEDGEIGLSIPGFHLEGPYISPEDGFRGSHLLEHVRPPLWSEFRQYQQSAQGGIRQVTLAPEIEGAMEFIRRCVENGIRVGLGHHNASAALIREAADAGAVISTHLGNGCANLIHRHDNPLWPQLAEGRLSASIIADGIHLRPEQVRVFYGVKGSTRTILTSDATQFAGMPPGEYTVDGRRLLVTPEGMVTYPAQNVLAGAAVPLTAGVSNLMAFTDCSLADAVHAATRNTARLLGLDDRGEIRPGSRADLILFTLEEGRVQIQKTLVAGRTVYERQ